MENFHAKFLSIWPNSIKFDKLRTTTNVILHPSLVNLGNLSPGEKKNFTFKCKNNGFTDTVVAYDKFDAKFCGHIEINPTIVMLKPHNEIQFCVQYMNKNVGKFKEDILFSGDIRFRIMGEVQQFKINIKPTVINFLDVAVCCRYQKKISVENMTDLAVKIHIKTPQFDANLLHFEEFFFSEETYKCTNTRKNRKNDLKECIKSATSTSSLVSNTRTCNDVDKEIALEENEK